MKKKVIIIENDEAILELVSYLLEEEGFDVISSEDSSVLDFITAPPDLLLIDEWLNGEKGSSICRQYKADPNTMNIPIVLMSAINEIEAVAEECRADAIIKKPFNIDELITTIKGSLR